MAAYGFTAEHPPSDAVAFKAQHLANTGDVLPDHGRWYVVLGEHNIYDVAIEHNTGWSTARWKLSGLCSCPATSGCSHLLAAGYFEHVNRKAKQ